MLLAFAEIGDLYFFSDRRLRDGVHQVAARLYGFVVYHGDHITCAYTRLIGRAARLYRLQYQTVSGSEITQHDGIATLILCKAHTNGSASDFPMRNNLVINI